MRSFSFQKQIFQSSVIRSLYIENSAVRYVGISSKQHSLISFAVGTIAG